MIDGLTLREVQAVKQPRGYERKGSRAKAAKLQALCNRNLSPFELPDTAGFPARRERATTASFLWHLHGCTGNVQVVALSPLAFADWAPEGTCRFIEDATPRKRAACR